MGYSIELMKIEHYPDVVSLWSSTEGIGLSSADSIEGIRGFLEHNPGLSYIASLDGKLAGAVLCGCDGRRGYIHHLAVAKNSRRLGIGSGLVAGCLDALDRRGIQKCHIFVYADNISGLEFWKAAGWKQRTELVMMSVDI